MRKVLQEYTHPKPTYEIELYLPDGTHFEASPYRYLSLRAAQKAYDVEHNWIKTGGSSYKRVVLVEVTHEG